jgi:hypothetical protein
MVNQINEAIDSTRFVFAHSIAQSFAQNTPTCAHTPSFHPQNSIVSSCKHTPRKTGFGLWNRGSRVQIPSLTPKLQDSTQAKTQDPHGETIGKAAVEQSL